jgi:hypothetical protein
MLKTWGRKDKLPMDVLINIFTKDEAQRQCYFNYGCPKFDPDNYICNGPVKPGLVVGDLEQNVLQKVVRLIKMNNLVSIINGK